MDHQDLERYASEIEPLGTFRTYAQVEKQADKVEAAESLLSSKLYALMALVRNWLDDTMLRTKASRVRDVA